MTIVAVYLSSRPGSVSGKVIDALLSGAEEAGAAVRRFSVGNTILGCRGCRACQSGKSEVCVVKDGLEDYWTEVRDADMVILGAGNYMGDVQGQAISFMNRHYSVMDSSRGMGQRVCRLPGGKKLIGVFAQGNGDREFYVEPYERYLRHFVGYGMTPEKPVVVTAADMSEEALEGYRARGRALVK